MNGKIELPDTDEELLAQCNVETFRAGGPGGQHQNRRESAVRITHLPSGITVTSRSERSQHQNKRICLATLRFRIQKRNRPKKIRRATRMPKAAKEKRLVQKKQRAQKKAGRGRVSPED